MGQLEIPEFPQAETHHVQPTLLPPTGWQLSLQVWEIDDEPDLVATTLEVRDTNGELLVLRSGPTRRNEGWEEALTVLVRWATEAWYEVHSPF